MVNVAQILKPVYGISIQWKEASRTLSPPTDQKMVPMSSSSSVASSRTTAATKVNPVAPSIPNLATQMVPSRPPPQQQPPPLINRPLPRALKPIDDDKVLQHLLGPFPTSSTFTAVISNYCKQGKLKKAFHVIHLMKTKFGCIPNIYTYNCLLKGLCYVGRVEEAVELLARIKDASSGLEPDIYTYSTVMDGFCKVGRSEEAFELLEEAVSRGLVPNVVTYNTLYNGYTKEGRPLEGLRVLGLMRRSGCSPDYVSFSTLVHGLVLWGEARAALGVYEEMGRAGFEGDERLVKGLIRRLCRASFQEADLLGDACQVFGEMRRRGFLVDHATGSLMIVALCKGKRADGASQALREMVGSGCVPSLVTWNCVIRALCFGRQVGEAVLVLLLMYRLGKMPSRTTYDLLIPELNRQGMSLVARNVYAAALVRGVVPCRKPACQCS